jgi:serine/threonine protein kinase
MRKRSTTVYEETKEEYVIVNTIAYGSFGSVHLALDRDRNQVCVKKENIQKQSYVELMVMKALPISEYVMRYYDVYYKKNKIHFVMEYCGKYTLLDHLQQTPTTTEIEAARMIRGVVKGVQALHSKGIAHRDLKLENIVIRDDSNTPVIIDFGFATLSPRSLKRCGSLNYVAPEIVIGGMYDGRLADMWSLGVCIFAIVYGKLLSVNNIIYVNYYIDRNHKTRWGGSECIRLGYQPGGDVLEVNGLIKSLLVLNPQKRAEIISIVNHRWFIKLGMRLILPVTPSVNTTT